MSKGPWKQRANGVGMKHSQPVENGEGPTLRHSEQQIESQILTGIRLPRGKDDIKLIGDWAKIKTKG